MTSRSVLGVLAFALVCLGSAAAQEQRVCVLTGSQEVGGVVTNAIGCGRFVIDPVANTVDYYIVVGGLSSAETAAHIHGYSGPGVNSPPVHTLPPGPVKTGTWVYPEANEADVLNGNIYVNVHTTLNPGGEVRGQVVDLVARLDELQENPPTGSAAEGYGLFRIDTVNNQLYYYIVHNVAGENNAHIHGRVAHRENAGVLHPLPLGSPKVGTWNYPEADEDDILRGATYVNIHSPAAPAGEIRGQITPVVVPIDATQEAGAVASPGVGIGLVSIDTVNDRLGYDFEYRDLTTPENNAHIHGYAPPGVNAGVVHPLALGVRKVGRWNPYPAANEAMILDGLTYVNIHTTMFAGGEIRGQLEFRPLPCPGDTNHDGVIDVSDLGSLLAAFGTAAGGPGYNYFADLNKDGNIDVSDLGGLLAMFGSPCPS